MPADAPGASLVARVEPTKAAADHGHDGDVGHDERAPKKALLVGVGGLAFTFGAIALEVIASRYANSQVPGWAKWVPLAWPAPLRVLWWLAVATAAGAFRWSLPHLGLRPTRVGTALTVGPFVALAVGVAIGADWATWH